MSVVYFLVLLGVLVAIHEFGHFLAAKLLDFKVIRFSIGFGRPLLRVRGRETEYQLALFPLGGYVRILGDDPEDDIPEEEARRAFSRKPVWQRLIVVFAGPFANFCLPAVIYFASFAGDTELPAAVIGDIIADTPADRAGFEPGDRILSINGDSVRYWEDVERAVHGSIGEELRFKMRRGEHVLERFVTPVEYVQRRRDGGESRHGLIGVTQAPFLPQIGVLDLGSPAGKAGLRTGDLIISLDGAAVGNWKELREKLESAPRRMNVTFVRSQVHPQLGIKFLEPRHAELVALGKPDATGRTRVVHGLEPAEMFVAEVEPESPVDHMGLRPGDLITHLDGQPLSHWMILDRRLRSRPDHEWTLRWQRATPGGIIEMSGTLRQELRRGTDEYGHPSTMLVFGARSEFERGEGEMVSIDGRLRYAASRSVERTIEAIDVMAAGFFSVLRGKSPREELGGPIMMFRVASVSGSKGWEALFMMIALISISVGLINLLPIPVLDGGHVLMFAVETIVRKPLSLRARRNINVVGLALVGVITVFALHNDVVRYIL